MSYQRITYSTDINSIIQQLYRSAEFQSKLQNKLQNLLQNRKSLNVNSSSTVTSTKPNNNNKSDKLIQEISVVIDTLIRNNLKSIIEIQFRGIKDDIWKLKDQLKTQGLSIDYLKRKIQNVKGGQKGKDKQLSREPLTFGQPKLEGEGQSRNRFQIMRKPGNLVVTSGGGSTTYTSYNSITSPINHNHHLQHNQSKQQPISTSLLSNPEIIKIKQQLQSLRKQVSSKTSSISSSQLLQISSRIDKNNDKMKSQLDSITKNSNTRFEYTEHSIKKHMQRSLQSLWKMITSIKNQLQQINSELHLNQSGIMSL